MDEGIKFFVGLDAHKDSTSVAASTTRVFPEPVGPRNNMVPIGLAGLFIPARYI